MKLSTFFKTTLATSVVTTLVVSQLAYADTIRLRMHTFYGTEIDEISASLRDRVSEASDGSVRIQFFRGGDPAQ